MLAHNGRSMVFATKMVWGRVWALVGGRVKCCPAPRRAPLVAELEISLACAHPAHNHSLIQSPILDQSVFIRWRTSLGAQPPKTPWWKHWILKVLLPRCFQKILRTTSRRTPFLNRKAGCFFVYIYIRRTTLRTVPRLGSFSGLLGCVLGAIWNQFVENSRC